MVNAGVQAEPMCLFLKITLKQVKKRNHFISCFILKPPFLHSSWLLVTLCIAILARLWIQRYLHPLYDNFSLSSSEHSGHHRIQSRHNQGVNDGHSQSPAFMFNHIRDDSVYMALLVLLQPWSRLCVIRKKGFHLRTVCFCTSLWPLTQLHLLASLAFWFIFSLWSTRQDRVGLKLIDTYFNNRSKMKSRSHIWHKNMLLGWDACLSKAISEKTKPWENWEIQRLRSKT